MSVIVIVGIFVLACLIAVAYVCLCMVASAKEIDEIEKELFDKRFDKGDRE